MQLIEALKITEAAPVGLVAMAVAVLLGILAPALCDRLRSQLILLGVLVVLAVAMEVLLRVLGVTDLLQIANSILTPFACGAVVGTLIQLVRWKLRKQEA